MFKEHISTYTIIVLKAPSFTQDLKIFQDYKIFISFSPLLGYGGHNEDKMDEYDMILNT